MRYYKNLLLGENMDDVDEIIANLDNGTPTYNIYLVCVSPKSNHLLEVMRAIEVLKDINANKNYTIIGMTRGQKSALEMVRDICQVCIDEGRELSGLKDYFIKNTI